MITGLISGLVLLFEIRNSNSESIVDETMLKPADLVVLAGLLSLGSKKDWTQLQLALQLGVSQTQVHRSLRQLERAGLWKGAEPRRAAIHELIKHGVRYVYPAELGAPARGVPTAHSAPGFAEQFPAEQIYVWPFDAGTASGLALEPIYPSVPESALRNPTFHELMAIIDIFRIGRARERAAADKRLTEILGLPT